MRTRGVFSIPYDPGHFGRRGLLRHLGVLYGAGFLLVITATLLLTVLPCPPLGKTIVYFVGLVVGLPFVFYLTRRNRIDNWLGELPYPVYITHALVQAVLYSLLHWTGPGDLWYGWWVVTVSVLFSVLLLNILVYPMDRIRQRRVPCQPARVKVSGG